MFLKYLFKSELRSFFQLTRHLYLLPVEDEDRPEDEVEPLLPEDEEEPELTEPDDLPDEIELPEEIEPDDLPDDIEPDDIPDDLPDDVEVEIPLLLPVLTGRDIDPALLPADVLTLLCDEVEV